MGKILPLAHRRRRRRRSVCRELLALHALHKARTLVEVIGEKEEPVAAVRDLLAVRPLEAASVALEALEERDGIMGIRDLEARELDARDLLELGADPDLRPLLGKLLRMLALEDGAGGSRYQLNLSELYYRKGRALTFGDVSARHEHNKWLESRYRALKKAIARCGGGSSSDQCVF